MKRLLALLYGVLLTILILEILLRVGFDFLPYGTQGIVQHVRRVPWSEEHMVPPFPFIGSREHQTRVAPGHRDYPVHWGDAKFKFSTISLWDLPVGFRTNEPQFPIDIVALGDSFTFCWTDVEDCWAQKLASQQGWSVMNLGVPGTGTLAHQSLVIPYVKPLEPKVIIWQWYGNDFLDDYDLARIQELTPELRRPPDPDPAPDYGWLGDYSAVYRVLRNYFDNSSNERETGFITTIHNRQIFFTDQLNSYDFKYPSVQYGYETSMETLQSAATMLRDELNAEWVIVLIPTKEEVYGHYLLDKQLDRDYYERLTEGRRRLLQACQANEWHCVDMLEPFTAAVESGKTVYHAFDFHTDASGNQIIADTIADYLLEQDWLAEN